MIEFVMHELFPTICNMSLTASVVIVAVLLVRLLLRRAPKVFSYALWAVVLFRLICPVSVTAAVSRRRCCWRLRPASAVSVCWRGCMSAATRRESRCLPSRSRCCFWRSARYYISCSADHWRSLRLLPLLSTM